MFPHPRVDLATATAQGLTEVEMEDENARFVAAQSLRHGTTGDYISTFKRYAAYCKQCRPPRTLDCDESCAAWLTSLLSRQHPPPVRAVTVLSYAKTLQAFFIRLRNPRFHLRPMQVGTLTHDVVSGAGKSEGSSAVDDFEAPTWEQIEAVDAAAVADRWEAGGVFACVSWEMAAHTSDTLEVRVCDVTEAPDIHSEDGRALAHVVLPTFKMDYKLGSCRRGMVHVISCPRLSARLFSLRDRRRSETGESGSRLWPWTRDFAMGRFRRLETPIASARAWRRGFITAALAAGFLRREAAVVTHHEGDEVMGLYTAGLPAAERDLMIRVVHAAKRRRQDAR